MTKSKGWGNSSLSESPWGPGCFPWCASFACLKTKVAVPTGKLPIRDSGSNEWAPQGAGSEVLSLLTTPTPSLCPLHLLCPLQHLFLLLLLIRRLQNSYSFMGNLNTPVETELLATGGSTISRRCINVGNWEVKKWILLTPRSREQAAGGCGHASRPLANAGGLDCGASYLFPRLSYPQVRCDGWVAGVDDHVGNYCILVHKPDFSLALELPEV